MQTRHPWNFDTFADLSLDWDQLTAELYRQADRMDPDATRISEEDIAADVETIMQTMGTWDEPDDGYERDFNPEPGPFFLF